MKTPISRSPFSAHWFGSGSASNPRNIEIKRISFLFVLVLVLCAGCAAETSHEKTVTMNVPTRLNVTRTSNTLSVSINNRDSLEPTNIVVDSGMGTGVVYDLFVYPKGQSRPPTSPYGGSTGSTDFNLGTHILNTSLDGIPKPGKSYNVDMDLVVYETAPTNLDFDMPPPPVRLMPKDKLFHILWRGELIQEVK